MTASPAAQAFLTHYQPLHERFVRYCRSRAGGLMDTEDLVQESVLAALENFERLSDPSRLLGYLIGTAANILRNQQRRLKKTGRWDEEAFGRLAARLPDPALAADIRLLLRAIEQLPAHEQEALSLFELSGFSIRETAEALGISEAAVKTRLSRARARLREWLAEDGRPLSLSRRLAIYSSILL